MTLRTVTAGLALVAASGSASAQFLPPGFRPGLYYNTPFGSVGIGYSYSANLNYSYVNPYNGFRYGANLNYFYAGPLPFNVYAAQTIAYQNALANQYAVNPGYGYLTGGVGSSAGPNPVIQEQLRQFAAARPARAGGGGALVANPQRQMADQMAFERGDLVRPPEPGATLDPAVVRPADEMIISGDVLNQLADAVRKLTGQGVRADSPLLSAELLARVNFDGSASADVLRMVRAGRLEFPPAFDAPAFAAVRNDLAAPAWAVLEPLTVGRRSVEAADRLTAAVKKARVDAAPALRDLPPGPAAEVTRFLNGLDALAQAGKDPALSGVYPSKWGTIGATAAELLAHMTRFGLTFGPAAAGNEGAYLALHRGLVEYYAALSQKKK
jgi:hypothetical protein